MTCLIAPHSYFFKPQTFNIKDVMPKEEWDTLVMHYVLDTVAYQGLEDKLDHLNHHRIK